ncbi:hypothetical protein PR003_g13024 [Phytophthora rubi]|uniref:Uncharacterized protein n=1 Tax=Phytophthora rubi TaxID=129364 RepID=A0A6A3LP74_9STRA|nr:hypothetical protein PR002_g12276 [Phytophthora rubi]KAE9025842.1 hypothetical protein PR001_g12331 [Phytophthora rubi]KAE9335405.1 hypothetical protein PR003_g13024 [Phytophthora rubi]
MKNTGDDGAESDSSTSSSEDTTVEATIALAPYVRSHYAKMREAPRFFKGRYD